MAADLIVPFPGGGAVLQVHSFQYGIFPVFFFDVQHGALKFFLPFKFRFFILDIP